MLVEAREVRDEDTKSEVVIDDPIRAPIFDINGKPPNPGIPAPLKLLHPRVAAAVRSGKKSGGVATAWLTFYQGTSGAANTAFSFNLAVQPNLDTNWTSWQAVFDEFTVTEVEVYWLAYFTVVPTALPANTPNAALAWDPVGATPTAVNQVLQHDNFSLLSIAGGASGQFAAAPQCTQNNGGYMLFRQKLPKTVDPSNVSTTQSTGQWRPTGDASNYTWGQILGYCAAGGTTSVIRIESFVRMKTKFRWLR